LSATPYRPLSWHSNEPVYEQKINQMVNNIQWLFERSPRMSYRAHGVRRNEGIKIAAGTAFFPANGKRSFQSEHVDFGGFFSAGCEPIVVTGHVVNGSRLVHIGVRGRGRKHPNHLGMVLTAQINARSDKHQKFSSSCHANWVAVGY
jgi:hypothetical protein